MTHGRRSLLAWLKRSQVLRVALAREIGISKAYMSNILNGHRRPSLETLLRIETRTGVPAVSWAEISVSQSDRATKRSAKRPKVNKRLTLVSNS